MSEQRYKVGDLLQINSKQEKKLFLVTNIEDNTEYANTYSLLTESGKIIWQFCETVDNEYQFRKIN